MRHNWRCGSPPRPAGCSASLNVTRHIVPSSRRIYLASLLFYPLGLLLHWAGLRTEIQIQGIASGYYQYQARRRGLGAYGIFLATK